LAETLVDFMVAFLGRYGGGSKMVVGALVVIHRGALEQQAQRLPINRQRGFGSHPGKAPQVPVQVAPVKGFASQIEGGVEQFLLALPVGHVHTQDLRGRAEAHAVFQVQRQEWRDMKRLGHGKMLVEVLQMGRRSSRQHVVKTLAPRSVADFAENRRQLAVGLVAIEKTHRVERQTPAARLGQQADRTLRCMAHGFADALDDWTVRRLEEAAVALDSFRAFSIYDDTNSEPSPEVVAALEDDLNAPRAIAELHRLLGESKRTHNPHAARTLFASCRFLGLDVDKVDLNKLSRDRLDIDGSKVEAAIAARNAARKAKDFKESDRIRDELSAMGIQLKDAKDPATGEIVTTWEVKR